LQKILNKFGLLPGLGTVVIYCGYGSSSYFGKVLVPVPVPALVPVAALFQFLIQTYLAQLYKNIYKILPFQ
jgi:hypothetical protein